ncbi:MAG TPA: chemotaxis protein CheB [Myxococcales bacterium]|jgi:two-component system chemotaxis response regulator CheB
MTTLLLIGASRAALREALAKEPGILVVGECEASPGCVGRVARLAPDMVVLALAHRHDESLSLASRIMSESPRPILVVCSEPTVAPALAELARSLGVLEVLPRLPPPGTAAFEDARALLARLVRVLSTVPVVTQTRERPGPPPAPVPLSAPVRLPGHPRQRPDLVVMGASTGGPPVLETILRGYRSRPGSPPVAIVQHMTASFVAEFAHWLSDVSGWRIVVVDQVVALEPGVAYVATDDQHLVVVSRGSIGPSTSAERRHQRPSVDVLFESAARVFGAGLVGVLLTGMGSDGVEGMATLKSRGAFTISQTLETCAVDSMPRGAIERRVVDLTADPGGIAAILTQYA